MAVMLVEAAGTTPDAAIARLLRVIADMDGWSLASDTINVIPVHRRGDRGYEASVHIEREVAT